MDAEQKAINDMFAAYQKLRALGWNDAVYCPKDGTVFETIEAGSSGIHRTHYSGKWPDGSWWVHDAGDLWPSRPILFRVIQDASVRDRSSKAAETSGSAEGKSPADLSATPAQTPASPPSATPEGDPPMTVEGWQTINTAPRDGTLVAIKGTFLGGGEWESQGWFETSPADRRWYDAADDEPCRPTHWRPLAPSESPSTKEASDA